MVGSLLFSVVIPTCHRNDLLAKCLDRLAPGHQTLAQACYEVIVTDDGSDSTAEELIQNHYPWVKWVAGPRRGPAANRNNGAKLAQGTWLVFTDDDCLPDAEWLEAYATAIEKFPDCQVFEGRTYVDRPRKSFTEKSPANETGGYLWSCNFAIKRMLFKALKGFDERFPYAAMEDVELRTRLKKMSQDFVFIHQASLCHPWQVRDKWKYLEQAKASTLLYLSIHPSEKGRINWRLFARRMLKTIYRELMPSMIKFKFGDLKCLIFEIIHTLQMCFVLIR